MRTTSTTNDNRSSQVRYSTLALFLIIGATLLQPCGAMTQTSMPSSESDANPEIVIGFVGGFVHKDDLRHSEVQLGQRLQSAYGRRVHVDVLQNRQVGEAQQEVLRWLDQNSDGALSTPEKQRAHIILFGHSWGAAAAVSLARELQRDGIPVLLTVQVDTVSRSRQDNLIIPDNVNEAVNFYQTGGLLHGRSQISAASPRTRILGNFRLHYRNEPAECRVYPWYDRVFFKGHTAIECDPRVWSQVEDLIRTRLSSDVVVSQVHPSKPREN
jgi:hypothetical protein